MTTNFAVLSDDLHLEIFRFLQPAFVLRHHLSSVSKRWDKLLHTNKLWQFYLEDALSLPISWKKESIDLELIEGQPSCCKENEQPIKKRRIGKQKFVFHKSQDYWYKQYKQWWRDNVLHEKLGCILGVELKEKDPEVVDLLHQFEEEVFYALKNLYL
jgi:hypothetical protein